MGAWRLSLVGEVGLAGGGGHGGQGAGVCRERLAQTSGKEKTPYKISANSHLPGRTYAHCGPWLALALVVRAAHVVHAENTIVIY